MSIATDAMQHPWERFTFLLFSLINRILRKTQLEKVNQLSSDPNLANPVLVLSFVDDVNTKSITAPKNKKPNFEATRLKHRLIEKKSFRLAAWRTSFNAAKLISSLRRESSTAIYESS